MEIKFKITNINYKNIKTNYYILRGRVLKNTNKILKLKNVTVKGTINKQTISKGDILTIECNYNKTEDCLYFTKLRHFLSERSGNNAADRTCFYRDRLCDRLCGRYRADNTCG